MKNWKTQVIILGCICILFGGNFLFREQGVSSSGMIRQAVQSIQENTERNFLPGVIYQADSSEDINSYILEKALDILSVNQFVFAKEDDINTEDEETYELLSKLQEGDEETSETESEKQEVTKTVDLSLDKLKDFDYLISKFYTVDSVTYVNESDFDVEKMLSKDFSISKGDGPRILIFHTHSQEQFADSDKQDGASIVDVGDYLTELLEEKYGIEVLHHTGIYDMENGSVDRSQAYERARPEIEQILEDNPTIEIVIDLHRDGVGKNTRLVTEVNGKQTAQIMFFNGMCRTRTNGDLSGMLNPYLEDNLAFSLQMKVAAETMYPGFTRRNYIKGYKYNMDLAPNMLLIEAGAQTNTVEEIMNAMEPLAEILYQVVGY